MLRRRLPYMSRCPLAQVMSSRRGTTGMTPDRHQHVWVKGDYQAERRGEHYVASEWSKNQDGRYHFDEGRWEHDK